MKIVTLCENTAIEPYQSEHGLSLYIETSQHRLLFDCGQSELLIKNAEVAGVDLTTVDSVILSHGHYDHCGGVMAFHQINPHAKIYIHRQAFSDYYHVENGIEKYIGINPQIMSLPNVILCDGNMKIDDELELIQEISRHHPLMNNHRVLKKKVDDVYEEDNFQHEMVLLIHDDVNLVCGGCAHNGILNILDSIKEPIDIVISGFHLKKKKYDLEDYEFIDSLGQQLKQYPVLFYTGHCTGKEAYEMLKDIMGNQLENIYTGKVIKTK